MAFQNGRKKTGGRTKGTPNKLTREVKHLLTDFIHKEIEFIQDNMDQLSVKERAMIISKLLPYVLPKVDEAHYSTFERDPDDIWHAFHT